MAEDVMDFTLFEARPGISVLLLPDPPVYTVVAVSNDFVRTSGIRRDDIVGKGLFAFFPQNPIDPHFTGHQTISASFRHVLDHKEEHRLSLLRYDIPNGDGTFAEKYWKVINIPVLGNTGAVTYIIHTSEDITLQVKAGEREEAIRDIEKAYNLFMQAPVAICVLKGPGYFVELANEHMLQSLGRTPAMIGKPLLESLPDAGNQGLIAILDHVRTTGGSYRVTHFPAELLINGVREQRYFDLVFKPFFLDTGEREPASIFCAAHNVTQQVLDQKNREESEHRFRTLIEEASVATGLYLGRELRIEYVNDMMLSYWRRDRSVLGKTLEEAMPELKGQPFLGYLDRVYTTGEPYTGVEEEAWLEVDGRLQPFCFTFTFKALRDKEGRIYGIQHMALDVTEQVRARRAIEASREDLHLAMEIAELGTFQVDLQTNTGYASDRVREWFGLKENTQGMDAIFDAIHPDDRERVVKAIQGSSLRETNSRHDLTYRVQGGGVLRYVRSIGHTFFDAQGKALGIRGVIQDVTPQVNYQQQIEANEAELQQRVVDRTHELEKLNEDLQRSNANLEEFAYVASHDLKEPIRKIQFFTDRIKQLLDGRLPDDQVRLFDRVENAVQRMHTLIDDLLSYSRVSQGASELESIDLNRKVKNVLEDLELKIQEKGARVTVGPLPVVRGNRRQLQQLFQNLLGNALKYSREDVAPEVHISSREVRGAETPLSLTASEAARRYHHIEVRDNGIGFPQQDAERIFKIFQRLHGRSEYEGTGVGLAIVQKVVDNMGGKIWAEGRPDEGAVFHLLLPVE